MSIYENDIGEKDLLKLFFFSLFNFARQNILGRNNRSPGKTLKLARHSITSSTQEANLANQNSCTIPCPMK